MTEQCKMEELLGNIFYKRFSSSRLVDPSLPAATPQTRIIVLCVRKKLSTSIDI